MVKHMSTAAAALVAVAMAGTAGVAQQAGGQAGADAGGAGRGEATTFDFGGDMKGEETAYADFNASFDEFGLFGRWDVDQDTYLTFEELGGGIYGAYDVDRDEFLTEDEVIGMGQDTLLGGAPTGWFVWQSDDAMLDRQGFYQGFRNWNTYAAWDIDQDQRLSREEFNRGVFSVYDVDGNDILTADEMATLQRDRIFTY